MTLPDSAPEPADDTGTRLIHGAGASPVTEPVDSPEAADPAEPTDPAGPTEPSESDERTEPEVPTTAVQVVGLDEPVMMPVGGSLWQGARKTHTQLFWGPWARAFNCRGKGLCPLCKVAVLEGLDRLPERNKKETKRLQGKPEHWRLACQIPVVEGLVIDPFPYVPPEARVPSEALEEAKLRRRALQGDEAAQQVLEERAREQAAEAEAAEAEAEAESASGAEAASRRKGLLGKVRLGPRTVAEAETELAAAEDALAAHDGALPQTKKEKKPWAKEKARLEKQVEKAKRELEKAVAKAEKEAEKEKAAEAEAVEDPDDGITVRSARQAEADTAAGASADGSADTEGAEPSDPATKGGFRLKGRKK